MTQACLQLQCRLLRLHLAVILRGDKGGGSAHMSQEGRALRSECGAVAAVPVMRPRDVRCFHVNSAIRGVDGVPNSPPRSDLPNIHSVNSYC